jgi:hypothetical protein
MPLVAIAADKGAPGVTTLAVALGAVWPRRALVAECDPAGGDIALRLRGPNREPLEPEVGLLSLAASARRGLQPEHVWQHAQVLDGGLDVLVGLAIAEQAQGMGAVWQRLGDTFEHLPEADVIADCGRVSGESSALAVVGAAQLAVFLVRPTVDAVAHLRDRLEVLEPRLRPAEVDGVPVGVVVVCDPGDERSVRDVQYVLDRAGLHAAVIGRFAHDPAGAAQLSGRWGGRLDRSLLVRSARELAVTIDARLIRATAA